MTEIEGTIARADTVVLTHWIIIAHTMEGLDIGFLYHIFANPSDRIVLLMINMHRSDTKTLVNLSTSNERQNNEFGNLERKENLLYSNPFPTNASIGYSTNVYILTLKCMLCKNQKKKGK